LIESTTGKPDPPQAPITIKGLYPKDEYEIRESLMDPLGDPSSLLAPLGSKACFSAVQGELVYYRIDGYNTPGARFTASNPVTNLVVTPTVNGYSDTVQLGCAGWNQTFMDIEKNDNNNVGAIQTWGTCTTLNTGPNKLSVASAVYFDEKPYILYREGRPENGVLEDGQPSDKYRPALYTLPDKDAHSVIDKAIKKLTNATNREEIFKGADNLTTIEGLVSRASGVINSIMRSFPPSSPIRQVLWVHLAILVCMESQRLGSPYNQDDVGNNLSNKLIKPFFLKRMRTERTEAQRAINERSQSFGTLFAVFDKTYNPAASPGDKQGFIAENTEALLRVKDMWITAWHNWLKRHFVGIAKNEAEPGNPVHLILGSTI
jgi:hypothetical protein